MVDTSGSMKGLRMIIVKYIIIIILDTLGENDFVNIIVVSVFFCFRRVLFVLEKNFFLFALGCCIVIIILTFYIVEGFFFLKLGFLI